MTYYTILPRAGNKDHDDFTLPSTPAGEYVHRRFCIRPLIADLVAFLAGLGSDQRAA
jgi:hypothetical protein